MSIIGHGRRRARMRVLANGVEIPDDDNLLWLSYGDRCLFHRDRLGVCLHEEPPKSLNPKWREHPECRFLLCNECHEWVHTLDRHTALELLVDARRRYAFPSD